jgi:hypothetical protein
MSLEKKSTETRRIGRLFTVPQSIDTSAVAESDDVPTPMLTSTTAASTQSTQVNVPTPRGVRGKSDLRSPGAPISPTAQSAPIPDFITQTDKFGKATTPRSPDAIASARKSSHTQNNTHETAPFDEDQPVETVETEDSGESILENLRMMCCCLLSDVAYTDETNKGAITSPPPVASDGDKPAGETSTTTTTQNNRRKRNTKSKISSHSIVSCGRSLVDDDAEPMKLLPSIHPHDEGKKCLVLDLDETLVHSSFRAVSGADFVLPVQVCHQ